MEIWKYPLSDGKRQGLLMPEGATPLHVETQGGTPCIWALVDPKRAKTERVFDVVGTGWPFDPTGKAYLGTFLLDGGALIFHVYEVGAKIDRPEGAALAPGDVVRLRSGGPAMTVLDGPDDEGEVRVGWYEPAGGADRGAVESCTVRPAALCRVEDEQRAEQERRGLLGVVRGQHRILDRAYAALEQIEPLLAGDLRHEASRESLAALKKDIFSALGEDV